MSEMDRIAASSSIDRLKDGRRSYLALFIQGKRIPSYEGYDFLFENLGFEQAEQISSPWSRLRYSCTAAMYSP